MRHRACSASLASCRLKWVFTLTCLHSASAATRGCVVWSAINATWFGDERDGPAQPFCRTVHVRQECLVARPGCAVWWRAVSDDVIPPTPELAIVLPDDASAGACRGANMTGALGIADDSNFGRCVVGNASFDNGGGFDILQARRHTQVIDCGDRGRIKERWRKLLAVLDENDYELVGEATGQDATYIRNVSAAFGRTASACDFEGFLSVSRLFVHVLNVEGLHALRATLAERLRDQRLIKYAPPGPLLDAWRRDGVLIRPYISDSDVYALLRVAAAEPVVPPPPYDWVVRNVAPAENDPQGAAHVDSFASVVKVWVFEAVSFDEGPLHVARGSHRHTKERLAWEHARANGEAALLEPSFRLAGPDDEEGAAAFVRASLADAAPIVAEGPIVVVVDTSLVHFRGAGSRIRRSRRLRGDNGGGLARRDPFRFAEEL